MMLLLFKIVTLLFLCHGSPVDGLPNEGGGGRLVLLHTPRQDSNSRSAPDAVPSPAVVGDRVPISFDGVKPDPPPPSAQLFRTLERPRCFDQNGSLGYCTEDPEYDDEITKRFDEILRQAPLSNIITDVLNETVVAQDPVVHTRTGFVTEQTPCLSRESIIYPKRGKTANSDWVFILNHGNVQQGVKVEKCIEDNSRCQFGGGGLPETVCRQKFIYKKLLAMDAAGGNIVSESVFLPSCCVCYVTSNFITTRNAISRCLPGGLDNP